MKTLILGGPGAGKTEHLLNLVEAELQRGTSSYRIGFVSFTNKAVDEAVERAGKRFNLTEQDLPFFRTLHSLAYRQTGVQKNQVLGPKHMREIGDYLGVRFSNRNVLDDTAAQTGDHLKFLDDLARNTGQELEKVWHDRNDWDISWYTLLRFSQTLKRYKQERGLIDFHDMLDQFNREGDDVGVEVVFIDEAQDLTHTQWQVIDVAFKDCERMYVAGDDDQAIYEWSGADVRRFLHLGEDQRVVLPQSHRLPRQIFNLAKRAAEQIKERYPKKWAPQDREGSWSLTDAEPNIRGPGTWLLLARNICFLQHLEELCMSQGVTYTLRSNYVSVDPRDVALIKEYESRRSAKGLVSSDPIWHEANIGLSADRRAYYVTVLRNGGSLTKPPRHHIDTIHGVKGGEADNVLLMTDLTRATEEAAERDRNAELRVFYVGLTRAREQLLVMRPTTERGFHL